ncbi:hypothetical protein [Anaerococcus sp.]|uniref:hypothetical protein n=1 Tax=Anaerococcus sp. TaxID=1872515 RepID=UPI002A747C29|nr:hypothetical protein [Anaerococcus sp.]MDY2928283.1 hypothetical protein [Anaerococcus sp.]
MPTTSFYEQVEYLTRLLLESKDLSDQTPESIVKLYKETYEQVKEALSDYGY